MTVIDASVFISGLLVDEERHQISRHWLQRQTVTGARVLVPVLALPEIAGAMARRLASTQRARQALDQVTALPGLTVVDIDHDLGFLSAELAASLRLRGADAVYVAVAVTAQQKLITWDQEVVSRAASAVEVGFPDT